VPAPRHPPPGPTDEAPRPVGGGGPGTAPESIPAANVSVMKGLKHTSRTVSPVDGGGGGGIGIGSERWVVDPSDRRPSAPWGAGRGFPPGTWFWASTPIRWLNDRRHPNGCSIPACDTSRGGATPLLSDGGDGRATFRFFLEGWCASSGAHSFGRPIAGPCGSIWLLLNAFWCHMMKC